ncbi:MAG: DUF1295 domain-containing protein, partial [Acidobacteriota bacterium]
MTAMIAVGAASVMTMMLLLWLIHLKTGNASVVDPGWAGGLALIAVIYANMADGYRPRVLLIAGMAVIWGLRLALYLLFTRVIGHPEEGRYVELRRTWGTNIWLKFLVFFEFQAVLSVLLSGPFLLAMQNPSQGIHWLEWTGAAVWLIAFVGEAMADSQLNSFKQNPANKGKTCRAGLWGYSRHPNYFFEWLHWFAYVLMGIGGPYCYLAWLCPAMMLYFLFRVTGIPATEAQALRTKGDDYREYQRTTNAFVPWPNSEGSKGAMLVDSVLESDLLPDSAIRFGIRRLLKGRLAEQAAGGPRAQHERFNTFLAQLRTSPIAIQTDTANQQHYEVPAEFYRLVLGPHLKYSSGWWQDGTRDLAGSEKAMLQLTCERAQLKPGQEILELGCGWGSLSLWMADHYPDSKILAVSNSKSQKAFIDGEAQRRGLRNLEIVTADMNDFSTDRRFDRIVSVEMFEHMRNYRELLRRISEWSRPEACLFVHIFSHRQFAYPFEVRDASDWMAQHFFSGGLMPSENLLLQFQDHFQIRDQWQISGTHYQQTCEAWLTQMDQHRTEILALFAQT